MTDDGNSNVVNEVIVELGVWGVMTSLPLSFMSGLLNLMVLSLYLDKKNFVSAWVIIAVRVCVLSTSVYLMRRAMSPIRSLLVPGLVQNSSLCITCTVLMLLDPSMVHLLPLKVRGVRLLQHRRSTVPITEVVQIHGYSVPITLCRSQLVVGRWSVVV
jgi:hypothetical protein